LILNTLGVEAIAVSCLELINYELKHAARQAEVLKIYYGRPSMFDIEDPWTRLELMEEGLFQIAQVAEQQAEQLRHQAELLQAVTEHLNNLSQALVEVIDRITELEQR
jgi:hypothetical protein